MDAASHQARCLERVAILLLCLSASSIISESVRKEKANRVALDIQEQLALLRARVAKIDQRFANSKPAAPPPQPTLPFREDYRPVRYCVEEWLSGQEIETPHGRHFESERLWESHRRHGSMDISALADLPHDLLGVLSDHAIPDCCPTRWAFLDTETTGLAGGTGTYAFLIGVGRITREGFYLRQFFMRDHGEEASLLHALTEHLAQFDVLVTFNGKTYDQPLLETRYRMSRFRHPFTRLQHLDLLFGARRLWKLRIENCRLVNLENQILGVERVGDLPGDMIPYVYFEFLRTREVYKVAPILHHNAIDILSLACLTGIVPWAFRSPEDAPIAHGADMVGIARWLRGEERYEEALRLFRRAVERGLKDDLLFRTLWDTALLEKKLGRDKEAVPVFTELSTCRNAYRLTALEELAKYYEHREKDYARALEHTRTALNLGGPPALHVRAARLERRLVKKRPQREQTAKLPLRDVG